MKTAFSEKPVARCFDDENGKEYQVAYVHGYWFGDRLLEGVFFRVEILPDHRLSVTTDPGSRNYMKKLNEDEWLKEAVACAETQDIFYETPQGGHELSFKDYHKS